MDADTEVSYIDNSCRLVCLYDRIHRLNCDPQTPALKTLSRSDVRFWGRLTPAIQANVEREWRDAMTK